MLKRSPADSGREELQATTGGSKGGEARFETKEPP